MTDFSSVTSISEKILEILPQKPPFRFLDRIVEVDAERIVGEYTFRSNEWFYEGHFPGFPLTPGVIMVETMAQTAVVALGIYQILLEARENPRVLDDEYLTVFSSVEAEFLKQVEPGARVIVKGERLYWRMKKLKSRAYLYLENGDLAATATLSGVGIKK